MNNNIKLGDTVIMPEPNPDDVWIYGDFAALVIDILDDGMLIVEDGDSDCFTVEASRVTKE